MEQNSSGLTVSVRIKSADPQKSTADMLAEIMSNQQALLEFLQSKNPEVSSIDIQPEAAFPGVETIVIIFVISFVKGFGGELGKRAGRFVGRWIEDKFIDVKIESAEDSTEPPE